jgi:hypothetical protein
MINDTMNKIRKITAGEPLRMANPRTAAMNDKAKKTSEEYFMRTE